MVRMDHTELTCCQSYPAIPVSKIGFMVVMNAKQLTGGDRRCAFVLMSYALGRLYRPGRGSLWGSLWYGQGREGHSGLTRFSLHNKPWVSFRPWVSQAVVGACSHNAIVHLQRHNTGHHTQGSTLSQGASSSGTTLTITLKWSAL